MEILKTEHRIILFAGSALTMSASTLALKWAFQDLMGSLEKRSREMRRGDRRILLSGLLEGG